MTIVGRIRGAKLAPEIRTRQSAYEGDFGLAERQRWQLEEWNRQWSRIVTEVPYYREHVQKKLLPSQFSSWQEFTDLVPVTTRDTVYRHGPEMYSRARAPEFYRITGGSTAQPVQLPAWISEVKCTQADMWLGRAWYGVAPSDRMFTIWGHSHLLGRGIRGWVRGRRRELFDHLLGYFRLSAYELTPEKLRAGAQRMLRFRPQYLMGYSVALDLFARANLDLAVQLRELKLKVVIATSESFPSQDSESLLADVFGCPVAMEYGSVETAVIGHTHPTGGYHAFWRSNFIEAAAEQSSCGGRAIRLTSLYPRCFPLVRYELGDEIEMNAADAGMASIARFQRVIGRINDYIELQDGTRLHSEVFVDAIRVCPEVAGFQVVQRGGDIRVRLLPKDRLTQSHEASIRARLARIDPRLAHVSLEKVSRLEQTISGKTRAIVRR